MKGLILAAGRGSRMGALTDDRPKCMVEIGGRTLFDRQCAALRAAGCAEIGVVRGWQGRAFDAHPVRKFDNPRWAETNMVRSLECAAEWLAAGPCLVSYADIFYSGTAAATLAAARTPLAVAYDPDWLALWRARFADPLDDAETFKLSPDGALAEIGRKPASLAEVEGQYMGLLKFAPEGWTAVAGLLAELAPARADKLDMTSMLRLLLARGVRIGAVAVPGPWGEVDSASDLALYRRWAEA
ncbi:MAG: phosphocholine cytidylyltransferase family protein [Azospirillum sp.]|nr:phosphocholine cytidylyltransferase family protein [Azospirillum sp.]MCZ8124875.1 phosphocholine cytidylyltransferase family protein [Magnetospirillum sp.]